MFSARGINIDLLIMEVKNRPYIWDIKNLDYKDRRKKHLAWEEICRALFSNFEQLSNAEKRLVRVKLQQKWHYIRKNYKRRTKQSVSGPVKNFKETDQLTFLSPILEMENVSACCLTDDAQTIEEQEEGNPDETTTSPESVLPTQVPASLAIKPLSRHEIIEPKTKLSKFRDNYSEPTPHVEDENTAFFNSLLHIVRSFDMDENIEFRSEILHIVQRIRGRKFQRSCPPYQTQPLSVHTGAMEYVQGRLNGNSTSLTQFPNDDNLELEPYFSNIGQTPHLFEQAPNRFKEIQPQKKSRNTTTFSGLSDEIEIINLSPKIESFR